MERGLSDDNQRSAGGQELQPWDVYNSTTGVMVAPERAWHMSASAGGLAVTPTRAPSHHPKTVIVGRENAISCYLL